MQVGRTEIVTQIDGNRLDTGNQKVRFMFNLKFHKFASTLYALKTASDKVPVRIEMIY